MHLENNHICMTLYKSFLIYVPNGSEMNGTAPSCASLASASEAETCTERPGFCRRKGGFEVLFCCVLVLVLHELMLIDQKKTDQSRPKLMHSGEH